MFFLGLVLGLLFGLAVGLIINRRRFRSGGGFTRPGEWTAPPTPAEGPADDGPTD